MKTVKTTLFPDAKNRSVYFDVDESISAYERGCGRKLNENAEKIIRSYGSIINQAYNEGFRDGKEAAANE